VLGHAPDFVSEEDARAAVRELNMGGVGFLKVYATMPWPLQRVAAEEARRLGLPVVAHGMSLQETIKGVTLGYAVLEHSGFRNYEDVLQMLAAAGTHWDPTVGATLGYSQLLLEESEWPGYARLRGFFPTVEELVEEFRADSWKTTMVPVILAQQLASVRAAHAHGIPLHAGTDAPEPGHLAFPGLALHWELEHLAQAGIPLAEVLEIATRQAAIAVGAGDDLGTLEIGKLADMVLLDANPLEDIRNTLRIWRVIKGGRVFDPDNLRPDPN
jgi:imidazolonepropionase-like amidohydrolase